MATDSKKKRAYASNALLYAFFVIGALVLANLLGTRLFGRIDLTENKVYTLSKPSKDLVKGLNDYFTVKAFISSDLPPELKLVSQYTRDLLEEYKNSGHGKFRWEALEPGGKGAEDEKKIEEEATRCKVQKIQIQVLRNQKFELGSYYLGLCLEHGEKLEAIPQVVRAEGLEYQISSLIKKMTTRKKKIAFTTGHGEADTTQGLQSLKEDLEAEFEATTVNPSTTEIAADVDALVIAGPKQAFDEKGQKAIDKFLMQGKGAVFLVDGMVMQAPGGMQGMDVQLKMSQKNEPGLSKLLDTYGFKIGDNFVMDEQNVPGIIDVGGGRQMLQNAPWFLGAEILKDKDLSVVAGVAGVVFPFPSSVDLVGPLAGGKPAQGQLWKLASSSAKSWKFSDMLMITPNLKRSDIFKGTYDGPHALGYAYTGPLKSPFGTAAPANASAKPDPAAHPSTSAKPVRLVVMGDSDFTNDEWVRLARSIPYYAAGPQLLFNAISWTIEDEALVPLRAKTMTARPLKAPSEGSARALQLANVVGLPLAFCLFGLVRWRVRRRTRLGLKL